MKIIERVPNKSFLNSIQKDLNVFLSMPNTEHEKQEKTGAKVKKTVAESTNIVEKKFEFIKAFKNVTNKNAFMQNSDSLNLDFEGTKSANSILEINKIRNTISLLEKKHNNQIAKKYLNGFLEERGFGSFKDFVTSLA